MRKMNSTLTQDERILTLTRDVIMSNCRYIRFSEALQREGIPQDEDALLAARQELAVFRRLELMFQLRVEFRRQQATFTNN